MLGELSSASLVWYWHLLQHLWLGPALTSSLLFCAPFAGAGGGCSGTGPDRDVGRQGFLLLAPWVVVLLLSASLEQASDFPGWGC